MPEPVVIVGAGLAGLACAKRLKKAQQPYLLVEASDRVGGDLRTETVDGFRLDVGFQTAFTSYPFLKKLVDIDELAPCVMEPALRAWTGSSWNEYSRDQPVKMAFESSLSLTDKLKISGLSTDLAAMERDEIWRLPDIPIKAYLRDMGFSEATLDRFMSPFFQGIFLDRDLTTSTPIFCWVWKMLDGGATFLPGGGVQRIADTLSSNLSPKSIRTGQMVESLVINDGRATGVRLASGEVIDAKAVVLAVDGDAGAKLAGVDCHLNWRSSTCLYFETPSPVIDRKLLLVDARPDANPIHVVPVSVVDPSTAPEGRHLVSTTLLGALPATDATVEATKVALAGWLPNAHVPSWRHIKTFPIEKAQLNQSAGFMKRRLPFRNHIRGLVMAGQATTWSSIDGALESGIRAAELILA